MSSKKNLKIYDHQLPAYFDKYPFLIWPLHWIHSIFHIRKTIVINTAKKLIRKTNAKYVLDAGCGEGNILIPLASRFKNVDFRGGDFNERLVDFLNIYADKFGLSLKAFRTDLNRPELGKGYDLILHIAVLQMLDDDAAFLKHLHSIGNKNAYVMLHVPLQYKPIFDWERKQSMSYYQYYGKHKKYTSQTISTLLENAGFVVDELIPTNGWTGTLANELFNYGVSLIQNSKFILKLVLFLFFAFILCPIILILNLLNVFLPKKMASGLVITARKK